MKQVLIVLTVPEEILNKKKALMRECVFNAGLIVTKNSEKLQFVTECKLDLNFIYIFLK